MDDEQEEDLDDDRGHEGGETEEAEEAEALQGIGSMSSKDTEDALRKARCDGIRGWGVSLCMRHHPSVPLPGRLSHNTNLTHTVRF